MPDTSTAQRTSPQTSRAPGAHGVGPGPAGQLALGRGVIGIVGAGQLARMMCEAASALAIPVVVLAERTDDAAALVAPEVAAGTPTDAAAMQALAGRCDVVTFDHEQVDLDILGSLERAGVTVRPGARTLRMAVDKAEMRATFDEAGLPCPPYAALGTPGADGVGLRELHARLVGFAGAHGWPVVVKAARGGYDGKGVWPVATPEAALEVCERAAASATPLLVEAHVDIDAELAVVVARRPGGETVAWPAVETAQLDGVCREVLYPGRLDAEVTRRAADLAQEVAAVVDAVGVLAVELFWSEGQLLVNEIAARPHNSAHWTIEGARTSQFENHLRAVLDLPLGDTSPAAPAVASVNVFGSDLGSADGALDPAVTLGDALGVPGAHVHLYGKVARPGRKLGHVTVCGDDPGDVRARAWAAARALGTPVPAALGIELS